MAQIFFDTNRHVALAVKMTDTKVDYVAHIGKNIELRTMDNQKFLREYSVGDTKQTTADIAKKLLANAKLGVSVSPAARFALEQVICINPDLQEATMAIPTTISKDKKATPAKKAPAKKTIAQAAAEEIPAKVTKLSETEPDSATVALFDKINARNEVLGVGTAGKAVKAKAEVTTLTLKETEVETNDVNIEAKKIVDEATTEAARLVAEATQAFEDAKKKAEEKKALETAKAEAKKIVEKAKAEVAKLKAQMAKLGGKSRRSVKAEGGEKAPRNTEDISGKKIKQVNEPTVREGSAAGVLTETIYGCKTVAEALEYEGVTPFRIKKMVEKGFIELVQHMPTTTKARKKPVKPKIAAPVIQGSDEWRLLRAGKVTASRVVDVMATVRSGAEAAARRDYRIQIVTERLTGIPSDYGFETADMRWGREQESFARMAYEELRKISVKQIPFAQHPDIKLAGASPDGLVGDVGLIEIKCPRSYTHLATIISGEAPTDYLPQMMWQMECTGSAWCDFVSFDPRFTGDAARLRLFVKRVYRDEAVIKSLKEGILTFIGDCDATIEQLKSFTLK